MKDQFLKIQTAAERIEVSVWTIRKWIKERRIRTYRFGGAVRIREADLMKFAQVRASRDDLNDAIVPSE